MRIIWCADAKGISDHDNAGHTQDWSCVSSHELPLRSRRTLTAADRLGLSKCFTKPYPAHQGGNERQGAHGSDVLGQRK